MFDMVVYRRWNKYNATAIKTMVTASRVSGTMLTITANPLINGSAMVRMSSPLKEAESRKVRTLILDFSPLCKINA